MRLTSPDSNRRRTATSSLRPRERNTSELLNPDPEDPVWKHTPGRYRSELHDRLAGALYPIAYVFLALAFVGQAQTTRQNRTQGVVTAIAAGFGSRIAGIGFANLVVTKPAFIPGLYAVPFGNAAYRDQPSSSATCAPAPSLVWPARWPPPLQVKGEPSRLASAGAAPRRQMPPQASEGIKECSGQPPFAATSRSASSR